MTSSTWQTSQLVKLTWQVDLSPCHIAPLQITSQGITCQVNLTNYHISTSVGPCIFIGKRRFPRGEFICTIKWPSNLGSFWVIFEGWSQILPSTKLFRHGFEHSFRCGDEKVGGNGTATQRGCIIKQTWLQEPISTKWGKPPLQPNCFPMNLGKKLQENRESAT